MVQESKKHLLNNCGLLTTASTMRNLCVTSLTPLRCPKSCWTLAHWRSLSTSARGRRVFLLDLPITRTCNGWTRLTSCCRNSQFTFGKSKSDERTVTHYPPLASSTSCSLAAWQRTRILTSTRVRHAMPEEVSVNERAKLSKASVSHLADDAATLCVRLCRRSILVL